MYKSLRIICTLALAALLLPACSRKQNPTPTDTVSGNSGFGNSSNDLIPNAFGPEGNYGPGLELRGPGEGFDGNMYNGQTMVPGLLENVYFGFDSSAISGSERSKLEEAANYLNTNPSDNLLIEGHCDWYGTAEYNLALGDRRANSAKEFLITLGINPTRIETLSKGSLESVSGLSKPESAQDRRAELIVLQ